MSASLLQACKQASRAPTRSLLRNTNLSMLSIRGMAADAQGSVAERPSEGRKDIVAPTPAAREVFVADVISGAPGELRHRAVRIYQPTRNTMQSGSAKSDRWRIDWDTLQGAGRWENPLMGYASSADYMQGTRILFRSKEDAIHFAEKQGWDYYVQDPAPKRIPPKNYAENYQYHPDKLRLMKTK